MLGGRTSRRFFAQPLTHIPSLSGPDRRHPALGGRAVEGCRHERRPFSFGAPSIGRRHRSGRGRALGTAREANHTSESTIAKFTAIKYGTEDRPCREGSHVVAQGARWLYHVRNSRPQRRWWVAAPMVRRRTPVHETCKPKALMIVATKARAAVATIHRRWTDSSECWSLTTPSFAFRPPGPPAG
jgi:hypothetical protein